MNRVRKKVPWDAGREYEKAMATCGCCGAFS